MEPKTPLRLFDIPNYQLKHYPNENSLAGQRNGSPISYSTAAYISYVDKLSFGLHQLGLKKGECVAIIAYNCPEWHFIDMAVMQLGAIVVPIYTNLSTNDYEFIFRETNIRICFIENDLVYQKILPIQSRLPRIENIYSIKKVNECLSWESLLSAPSIDLSVIRDPILPGDIATIIYTSGTTGEPKGVVLSHRNLLSNVKACLPLLPISSDDSVLSFLPVSHVFERMLLYLYQYAGASIHFATSLETIGDDIRWVKPHLFSVVPRIIEKLMEAIRSGAKKGTLKYWLLNWALVVAKKNTPGIKKHIAELLVFRTIRAKLGNNLKAVVCGSAAVREDLLLTFFGMGIPVYEGYGMTETSPVVSVNYKGNVKSGTVGKPIDGVAVKIAYDGEILVKGDNVMKAYYNRKDLTNEAIDNKGYFHSGDLGMIDKDGYLKITGRKKTLFKTSGGKYINPEILEGALRTIPYIQQIMVIGENQKFPAALIVPNYKTINRLLFPKQPATSAISLADPKVLQLLQKEIDLINEQFGHWEQIKKFALLSEDWSVETGELTPKLSLRRNVILGKYQNNINEIYPPGI